MKFIKKAKRGFTLVELVVVIAVIAILAAVSVGAYFGITDSANKSKLESEARGILTNIQLIANGNDSNSYMDKESIHIKTDGLQTFENKLNGMSGIDYEVTNQLIDENTEISKPTIYFIDSKETSGATILNASGYNQYFRFAYYTPDVGGKCAIYTFATQECKVQDASFKIGESTEEEPDAPAPVYATDFTFNPASLKLCVGAEAGWSTTPTPSNAEYTVIEGENEGVFEFVNETTKDMIRGLRHGTGSLIYKSGDFTKTFNITVEEEPVAATGITLTVNGVTNDTVTINNTINYDVVVNGEGDKDATNQGYDIIVSGVTYELDQEAKTIRPTSKGTMKIKVTSNDGNYTDEKSIEVYAPVTEFNVTVTKGENTIEYANGIDLLVGESIEIAHNFGETDPSNTEVVYSIKDGATGGLSNDNNVYTATSAGTATIVVSPTDAKNKTVEIIVNISNILVESLSSTKDGETITLERDQTFNLAETITISPSYANNKELKYESNNPNILISDGVVSCNADKNGAEGIVRVSTTDGSNKSFEVNFVFTAISVKNITLTAASSSINLDGSTTITAQTDGDTENPTITYTVNDSNLATIENGVLKATGSGAGLVTITAKVDGTNVEGNTTVTIENKKTHYFIDQEWWHSDNYTTYVYQWSESNGNTTAKNAEWPGIAIEQSNIKKIEGSEKGEMFVYKHEMNYDYDNVIYVRANGSEENDRSKTPDISLSNFGTQNTIVLNTSLHAYNECEIIQATYVENKWNYGQKFTFRMYLVRNWDWGSTYYCYVKSGSNATSGSGITMAKRSKTMDGNPIYSVDIDPYVYNPFASGAFFNIKGNKQTVDIYFNWWTGKIHDNIGWQFAYNGKDEVVIIDGFNYSNL